MPLIVTEALVLRRADWRDYDRMLTLLTPNGRMDAVARGCRRPKSALLAAAEPFTAGEYTLYSSAGRYTVDQFRITDTFYPLREDYERLTHGAYWLRLLETQALPNQPSAGMFALALQALARLSYTNTHPAILTMAFELHFLSLLGMAPQMRACVRCGKLFEPDARVDSADMRFLNAADMRFDAAGGGAACAACGRALPLLSNGARRILMRVPMTPFAAADKLTGHPNAMEAAKLCRLFLLNRMELSLMTTPDIPDLLPEDDAP